MDGVYFQSIRIYDDHEPMLKGAAEIDVYISGHLVGLWEDVAHPDDPSWYLAYSPYPTRNVDLDCAGRHETGIRSFNVDTEGTYDEVVLFAEGKSFGIHEEVKSKQGGLVLLERVVPSEPPYFVKVWERDDFNECPDGRRTLEVAFRLEFRWSGGWEISNTSGLGWEDFGWLWGGNNDLVGEWSFTSLSQVMQLDGWLGRNRDADLKAYSHGFDPSDIPPYSETWYVPRPY